MKLINFNSYSIYSSFKNLKKRFFNLRVKNATNETSSFLLDCYKDNRKSELKFSIEIDANSELIKVNSAA